MVAVHQRQLLSWEEDRQKVLTLEERCSKLEGQKCIQPELFLTPGGHPVKGAPRADGGGRLVSTQYLLSWSLVPLARRSADFRNTHSAN